MTAAKQKTSKAAEFATEARAAAEERIETFKNGARKTAEALQKSFANAGQGVRDVNTKVLELAQADANAYFEAVRKVVAAKTVGEAFEAQAGYVRDRFQTRLNNLRIVRKMGASAAKEAFQPIADTVKGFRKAA